MWLLTGLSVAQAAEGPVRLNPENPAFAVLEAAAQRSEQADPGVALVGAVWFVQRIPPPTALPGWAARRSVMAMRSAHEWLEEYGESHRHPVNETLHRICVPLIVLSLLGLLASLPVPAPFEALSPWLDWATLAALTALIYYSALSLRLAIGVAVAFLLMLLAIKGLGSLPWPIWISSLVIFGAAWIGQFIGHAIEGQRPSFFKDVQFLLIGPLWLVMQLYRRWHLAC